jgi:hypothetical protein
VEDSSRRLRLEEKRRLRTSPLKRPSLIIGSNMAVNFIVVSGQQNAVVSPPPATIQAALTN